MGSDSLNSTTIEWCVGRNSRPPELVAEAKEAVTAETTAEVAEAVNLPTEAAPPPTTPSGQQLRCCYQVQRILSTGQGGQYTIRCHCARHTFTFYHLYFLQ